MFGWRRRSEGFEWREYVRTTVLVRRADRQRRLDDARLEAVAKITDARDRGVQAGKDGLNAIVSPVMDVIRSFLDIIVAVVLASGQAVWHGLMAAGSAVMPAIRAVLHSVPMAKWQRSHSATPEPQPGERKAAPSAGRLAWLPRGLPVMPKLPLPRLFAFNPRVAGGAAIAIVAALAIGPMLQGSPNASVATSTVPHIALSSAPASVSGRASAVTGSLIRVNGDLVELRGIEAPQPKHPCLKANGRRWSCGTSAMNALNRLVRSETVTCDISGKSSSGVPIGTCRVGDRDIGAELVRGGHVFAVSGLFAAYTTDEAKAQDAKLGIWQGETVRPEEWRNRAWEDAKRSAPDGCPIKGVVRASGRVYQMPWSSDYASAKVREVKGERWFCSEDDAKAAGFKLSSQL
jgi:endonuclease YncB( thermonuclease family)